MRDSDFQEKMFAKQMAIIKGQAWNVVETLKSPDHGPLELTRRGRVCVWDDLVEVPVAIRMATQSSETQRKPTTVHYDDTNEMDIAAAGTSSNGQPHMSTILSSNNGNKDQPTDLLGFASPDQERPNPFNTSRQSSHLDVRNSTTSDVPERTLSPPNMLALSASVHSEPGVVPASPRRPGHSGPGARMSFDESRRHQRGRKQKHVRRLSHSARLVGGGGDEFDEDEGDLGFAVAEGRDAVRRKVIVERLENVKTKNPVFECC
jgi:hypothetical protein